MVSPLRKIFLFIVSGVFAIVVGLVVTMLLGALIGAVFGGEDSWIVGIAGAIIVLFVWWFAYTGMHAKFAGSAPS